MSEFWTPSHPEREPVINLNVEDGASFELNRLNTSLFRFMGRLGIYNHVFYHDIHEEEVQTSFYIFRFAPQYPLIEKYMLENQFTIHDNMTTISETDIRAYESALHKTVGDVDHVPDEWLK